AAQRLQGSSGATWPAAGGQPLAGMAHGAAGIARALAALADRDDDHRLAVAATAAVAWERSIYDPARRNWPLRVRAADPRERAAEGSASDPVRFMVAWCHGAPGLLVARSALGPAWRDTAWRREIEAALATTRDAPLPELDHLCCGLAGRAAALLGAGQRLGKEDALEAAGELTTKLLDRAWQRRRFLLRDGMLRDRWQPPDLLRGLAGIGWHLLRSAGVDLPDLLALELPSERCRGPAEMGGP
ncbi:MAG: hypothetical protein MI919_39975, partial [Holophagales bacterium]|nr:hypothetical protein [Holophagales bacterium]